jgi:diguanylate cyclase (GGDEF)-like protein
MSEPAPQLRRVLVVEDDEACRIMLRTALDVGGFEVVEARSGDEALATFASADGIGAVLLDLSLPDMTGFAVLRALKADVRTRSLPVLIVTGRTDTAGCVEGLAMGAHDFVRKPVDLQELLARVTAAVALHARLSDLEQEAASLEQLALTDPLTGLDNRRAGEQHLARMTARSHRLGLAVGLLMVDVDCFKSLNDRHGHLVGDAVLRVIAGRLRGTARAADVVARWGGEEFLVLLPDTAQPAAERAAERLREAVGARSIEVPGSALQLDVTVSVGVAALEPGDELDLVAAADAALYLAKAGGRNRVAAAVRAAGAARRGLDGPRMAAASSLVAEDPGSQRRGTAS